MSKKQKQKQQCLERLTDHVLTTGLSQTSLRQLAAAASVSDRMLLYYFKNKPDIMAQTLLNAAQAMALELNKAIPVEQKMGMPELLSLGIELTQSDTMKPFMRLSLQIASKASQGEAPYSETAQLIISGFIVWIEERLITADPSVRRRQAIFILAVIDGFGVLSVGIEQKELVGMATRIGDLYLSGDMPI